MPTTGTQQGGPALFNAIGMHLIRLPDAAARDIESAALGWLPIQPKDAAWAAEFARVWLSTLLAPHFVPDATAAFLCYPQEAGVCDTVRGLYQAGGVSIEVAQSRYLISLKLRGMGKSAGGEIDGGASDLLASVEAVAQAFFAPPAGHSLDFNISAVPGFATWGERDFDRASPLAPGWPHWADAMNWWFDGSALGFLTLRGAGEAVREAVSADPAPNQGWFSREPARWIAP